MSITAVLLIVAAADMLHAQSPAKTANIQQALDNRTMTAKRGSGGLVVTTSYTGGRPVRTFYVSGTLALNGQTQVSPDTYFEAGSLTKIFTALLLIDMMKKGQVSLDDPVSKYLGTTVVPTMGGQQITLAQLATHTSGLPNMPTPPTWWTSVRGNTADNVNEAALLASLPTTLESTPGTKYAYSNFGFGLLGVALSHAAGMSYASLIQTRIFQPLNMTASTFASTPAQLAAMATPYDEWKKAQSPFNLDAMAPAGGLRTTGTDMAIFLEAASEISTTPLQADFDFMRNYVVGTEGGVYHAGWMYDLKNGQGYDWHNGGVPGFRSDMAVVFPNRAALAWNNDSLGMEDIAELALGLRPTVDLLQPLPAKVTLPAAILQNYVGQYQAGAANVYTVTVQGDHLNVALGGYGRIFYASAQDQFFTIDLPETVTFNRNSQKQVTELVYHRSYGDQTAEKQPPNNTASRRAQSTPAQPAPTSQLQP